MAISNIKSIPVRIPGNLDCDALISIYTDQVKINSQAIYHYKSDRIKFLVNYLIERTSWDKRYLESNSYPFIELSSRQLKPYIRDYHKYLQFLIQFGVIEQSGANYSQGQFAKSYRLTEEYRTPTKDDYIRDSNLIELIVERTEADNQSAQIQYPYLIRWLPGLSIDSQLAKQWSEAHLATMLDDAKTPSERSKAFMKHANCLQSIARISRGLIRCIIDTSGHRMHHVLTNIKSELRNAITYNGQRMVSIDLSSSQIYLLNVLALPDFYSEQRTDNDLFHHTDLANNVGELLSKTIGRVRDIIVTESTDTVGGSDQSIEVKADGLSTVTDIPFVSDHKPIISSRIDSDVTTDVETRENDNTDPVKDRLANDIRIAHELFAQPKLPVPPQRWASAIYTQPLSPSMQRLWGEIEAYWERLMPRVTPNTSPQYRDQFDDLFDLPSDTSFEDIPCAFTAALLDNNDDLPFPYLDSSPSKGEDEEREAKTNTKDVRINVNKLDTIQHTTLTSPDTSFPMCANDTLSYMCADSEESESINRLHVHSDWELLRELVETGTFYEYMLDVCRSNLESSDELDRSNMKSIMFTVLFSKNETKHPVVLKHKRIFKALFPDVYRVIETIKHGNHATLALVLQNIESVLFLGKITKRIASERPDLPIFTIHDSVCTTVENEHYVENIIREELFKATGCRPFLKREYWKSEELTQQIDPDHY
jgi:hypothetical protein